MTTIRKLLSTGAIAAMVGLGALATTSSAADARTVCGRYHCWHQSSYYRGYPASYGYHHYGYYHHGRHHYGRGGLWIGF